MSHNHVYIVTEELLMRGFDYRSDDETDGLALLVAASFTSKRAYI